MCLKKGISLASSTAQTRLGREEHEQLPLDRGDSQVQLLKTRAAAFRHRVQVQQQRGRSLETVGLGQHTAGGWWSGVLCNGGGCVGGYHTARKIEGIIIREYNDLGPGTPRVVVLVLGCVCVW